MRVRILTIALFAGLAAVALPGCSDRGEEVSLSWLVERQASFDGEYLATRGTVRKFDDPEHYWIEDDAASNRVAIEPADQVAGLVGREVRISGRFSYRRDAGRRIVPESVQVIDD